MSCECYQIGGGFIAEDPDCEIHCDGGYIDQIDVLNKRILGCEDAYKRLEELAEERRKKLEDITARMEIK